MSAYAKKKTYPVTSVGPHELHDLVEIPDDLKWLVYWYEDGGYDGEGTAIFCCADGTYGCEDLDHCSCYGPTEYGSWTSDGLDADGGRKLLRIDMDVGGDGRERDPEDYDYDRWAALAPVVEALLP